MSTIRWTLVLCVSMSLMQIALGCESKLVNVASVSSGDAQEKIEHANKKTGEKRKRKMKKSERREKKRRLQNREAEKNREVLALIRDLAEEGAMRDEICAALEEMAQEHVEQEADQKIQDEYDRLLNLGMTKQQALLDLEARRIICIIR